MTKKLNRVYIQSKLLKCEMKLNMLCECHVPSSTYDVKILCHDQKCVLRVRIGLCDMLMLIMMLYEAEKAEMLIEYNLKFLKLNMCHVDKFSQCPNAVEKQVLCAIVGRLFLIGSVGSKLGHKWVKTGSNVDQTGAQVMSEGLWVMWAKWDMWVIGLFLSKRLLGHWVSHVSLMGY